MIEIIATAAVSGIVGAAATSFVFRYQRDWRIIGLCSEIDGLMAQAKNDKIWLDERAATITDLEAKLRAADQRATKAEVALTAEKARDSARTAKGNRTRKINRLAREAAAAGGWIEHSGGECPVSRDTIVDVKFADGMQCGGVKASFWGDGHSDWWAMPEYPGDRVIAYRIVSAEQREAA